MRALSLISSFAIALLFVGLLVKKRVLLFDAKEIECGLR